jgi:serine/threonine protein kinase
MENYLLYGEMSNALGGTLYKGRRKGTVQYFGLNKWSKDQKIHVTNGFKEWYETTHNVWVITELASGGSLSDLLAQDGYITLQAVPGFVKDIAAGLRYVHSHNIIYCDLQPEKICLDSCSTLKLSDFTLAFKKGEKPPFIFPPHSSYSTLTPLNSTATCGSQNRGSSYEPSLSPSPFYVAPECLQGEVFSFNSDLWSLGCVIFELCTGMKPFDGDTLDMLLHNIISKQTVQLDLHVLETGSERDVEFVTELLSALLQSSPQQRLSWQQLLALFHST